MSRSRVILWGDVPIKRSAIPELLADLSRWPTVDPSALEIPQRERFRQRQEAVSLFVEAPDVSLAEIARRTRVQPSQLYRLLSRCLTRSEDGRIQGFRGLLPNKHLKPYERTAEVRATGPRGRGGAAGALGRLLEMYPVLRDWLERQAVERHRPLRPGELREVRKTLRRLHKQFLDQCRAAGVRLDEWPFNRDQRGYRSIQAFIYAHKDSKREMIRGRLDSEPAGGVEADDIAATEECPPPALLPFDAVQFDGHKIDLRLTLRFVDPFGLETVFELVRLFILVCLDVATRAALGYHIAIAPEYDSDDVAMALQACFGPHKSPVMTMPELRVREGGGFPSQYFEEAQYPGWQWFQYDNAKANLAKATLERLSEITGCYVHAGRLGSPNDRPFIERFFAVLARSGLHQVPGTTGSSSDDAVKQLGEVGRNLHLMMTVDELTQVVEVLLGDYNGEAHGGLGGRTPLEAMSYWLCKPGVQIRRLPIAKRRDLIFLQEARIVTVRGQASLYINFGDERYTSDVLRDKAHLKGQRVRVYFNTQDIRQLHAYAMDGSGLGILVPSRPWSRTPHSLRQRCEIKRLVRQGKLRYRSDEDAIEVYASHKRKHAMRNKKEATMLAELIATQKYAAAAQNSASVGAPGEVREATGSDDTAPAMTVAPVSKPVTGGNGQSRASDQANEKPRPKPLSIRRTLNY